MTSSANFYRALSLAVGTLLLASWQAHAEANRVNFPQNLDQLVHYTTVKRGNVTEHIMTTPEAMAAVRNGTPIPVGTHFVLVDYRDGKLFRYFVMEKGEGFGKEYDERRRTADWQFQWFWPPRVKREMRDHLDNLRLRHAILPGQREVGPKLVWTIERDESGDGHQAPVALRELRALPNVAIQDVVRQVGEFRREAAHQLLRARRRLAGGARSGRRLGLRVGHGREPSSQQDAGRYEQAMSGFLHVGHSKLRGLDTGAGVGAPVPGAQPARERCRRR